MDTRYVVSNDGHQHLLSDVDCVAEVKRVKFVMDDKGKAGKKSNKTDEGLWNNSFGKTVTSPRNRRGLIKLRKFAGGVV
jgi:hypothetical protein